MKDDSHGENNHPPQDDDETPAIFSVNQAEGQSTLSRRTFLEIAAAAAATAALSTSCAPLFGGDEFNSPLARAFAHEHPITSLAVSSSGKLLASGDKEGNLKVWQLPEGSLLHSRMEYNHPIIYLAFTDKDEAVWSFSSSGILKRVNLRDGKKISNEKLAPNSRIVIPDMGEWYATTTFSGAINLHNRTTEEKLCSLEGQYDKTAAIAASPDGRLLLAAESTGKLSLWIEPKGAASQKFANTTPISDLTISPDGALALSAHVDGHLRTWRLPDLVLGMEVQSELGKPSSVAIRPQLDLFAVASEKPRIGLWKISSLPQEPQFLKGHSGKVNAIVITPDGSLLISAGEDKTIRLWSLPEGKYLRNLVDLKINYENVKGVSYEGKDVYGRTITYTLPCGSPIPPGAVCTCNCVPGSIAIPKNHSQNYNSEGYCTCNLICTCNTVCTCQSVGRGYYVSYWYPN